MRVKRHGHFMCGCSESTSTLAGGTPTKCDWGVGRGVFAGVA